MTFPDEMTATALSWKGKRCLVTGGAGFGGSHLSEQLLNRGATVYVLDRWFPNNSYLVLRGLDKQTQRIQGDVRDLDLVSVTLARFEIDTIFHLAAQPIVPTSNSLPLETLSVNALGTYIVLEAARRARSVQQFVFASSGAYYGGVSSNDGITEESPPAPASNIYSPSKVAADIAVRSYAKCYGINAVACRFMNTYGPGDSNFSRIVPRAILNLIGGTPYEFGDRDDGTTMLDYMYISDMASAYMRVAEQAGSLSGEAFNFSGGNLISTSDLARLISKLFDGKEREPLFLGPAKAEPIIKYLNTVKARRVLGWKPEVSLEHGLTETINWYRRFRD